MNIDSINHKDPELGIAISIVMKNLQHVYRDPLFKVIDEFQSYSNLQRQMYL